MNITKSQLLGGSGIVAVAGLLSAGMTYAMSASAVAPAETLISLPAASPTPTARAVVEAPVTLPQVDTPTPTPSTSPSPSQTATATPRPTPSPTRTPAPRPTATPTPRPTRSATPAPLPARAESVRVSLRGPTQVTAGETATYTMVVTWSQQRPGSLRFSFEPAGASAGCARPTTPPASHGPGSVTVSRTTTFDKAGDVDISAVALTACQYFEGSGSDDFVVHVVGATPSPTATSSSG